MKQLRIYLSSTFEDLAAFRAAVQARLEQAGLDVAQMESYTASDERPLDLCLRDVDESDIYVGLFGWRYGYEPPPDHGNPDARSITHLEYLRAEARGLRKLVFFAHPQTLADWPARFVDERTGAGDRGTKIARLRSELGTERVASFFRTPQETAALVLAAVMRSGKTGRLYNLPPRPPGCVPRTGLTDALAQALVAQAQAEVQAQASGVVVQGAGGFGKTTLALEACHEAKVIGAYPDGLLWVVLGERPDLARVLTDLVAAVTGTPPLVAGVEQIGIVLGKALAGRRCLVLVDDAWRADDLQPFLALVGPVLLVTTRIRSLVESAGHGSWPEVQVDEMDAAEAAALLCRGLPAEPLLTPAWRSLAEELGCWPLLLDLVNARLLEEHKARPGQLAESLARVSLLFDRKGVLGFDRRDSNARNAAVARSVEVGLERAEELEPGLAARARELSIFAEDESIPLAVLADLWATDPLGVEEDTLRHLDNLSLVRWERESGTVRLHDMIRRALAAALPDPRAVHRRLLDAWSQPERNPSEHVWRWFGWHCVQAGQPDRLLRLLVDVKFLDDKLKATDIDAVLGDFNLLPLEPYPNVEVLRRLLQMSAHVLAADKSQLLGQLLGRIPQGTDFLVSQLFDLLARRPNACLWPLQPSLTAPGGPLLATLQGHAGDVTGVAVPPDGSTAMSSSRDGTLKIWGLPSGRLLRSFPEKGGGFTHILLLNGGQRAVSATYGHTIQLWEVERGELLQTMQGPGDGLAELAADPDGRVVVSCTHDGSVTAWDLGTCAVSHAWPGLRGESARGGLVVTPDGGRALTAHADGTVLVLDLEAGTVLDRWAGGPVHALDASGSRVLVDDGARLRLFDLQGREASRPMERGPFHRRFALSADGRLLVDVCTEPRLGMVVWDVESGQEVRRLPGGHASHVTAVALLPDGRHLLTASRDRTLKLWDTSRDELTTGNEGHPGLTAVAVLPDGLHALTAGFEQLKLWDIEAGQVLLRVEAHADSINAVVVTPDGRLAVSGSSDATLKVWELPSGRSVRTLEGHTGRVNALALTPDGRRVVSASDDGTLKVWRLEDGSLQHTLVGHSEGVLGVAVAPDGLRVMSVNLADGPRWWDLGRGEPLPAEPADLPAWTFEHRSVTVTLPSVDCVALVREGRLYLLHAGTGSVYGLIDRGGKHITAMSVTPDGETIATAHDDQTLAIWRLEHGTPDIARFSLDEGVVDLAVTPDGETVVVGDRGGGVHMLRLNKARAPYNAELPTA